MIDLKRMASIALAVFAMGCVFGVGTARCASYPSGPIKVIVPYGPGGNGDIIARVLGEKVGAVLGTSVVVENRSGGNGVIGAEVAARARPDGYTLLQMATGHVILPSVQRDVPYDIDRDFTPVFGVIATPLVFALNATSSIKSIDDLVAASKSMSGGINYASGGTGSVSHLAAARLVHELKITATHIPYRGFSGAVQALLGDQVQFICVTTTDVLELAKSNRVRLLAVTSEQRFPYLPNVPTMAELGHADFYASSWNAYLAPANTPTDILDRLHDAYSKAAVDPGVQQVLGKTGVVFTIKTRAELGTFIHDEALKWRRVAEENHIKIDD